MASLESFQELLYMFGGGRASVLFITFMQIMVYSLMPIVFICNQLFYLHFLDNLDWMLYVELTEISSTLGRYCSLIIVIVCLAMLPVIFTRQFNRIKVCELLILRVKVHWMDYYDIECVDPFAGNHIWDHGKNWKSR